MTSCRYFLCDLASRQVTSFTWLCTLTDFDLDQIKSGSQEGVLGQLVRPSGTLTFSGFNSMPEARA